MNGLRGVIIDDAMIERAKRAYFGEDYKHHAAMGDDIKAIIHNSMKAALEAALSNEENVKK